MVTEIDKREVIDCIVQTGALRISDEGNNPMYISEVLKNYKGKSITIYGCFCGDDIYKFELDRLEEACCSVINEAKIKNESTQKTADSIKKSALYYPQVLFVGGELNGKQENFIFSKVLRVESEREKRDFCVDNKCKGIY